MPLSLSTPITHSSSHSHHRLISLAPPSSALSLMYFCQFAVISFAIYERLVAVVTWTSGEGCLGALSWVQRVSQHSFSPPPYLEAGVGPHSISRPHICISPRVTPSLTGWFEFPHHVWAPCSQASSLLAPMSLISSHCWHSPKVDPFLSPSHHPC